MKKKLLILITLTLLLGTVICISSCSSSLYDERGEEGYTVGIRFDAGGGRLKGREEVSIVELYHPDNISTAADGTEGIKILDPDDARRGDAARLKPDRTGYFLAGWYCERQEVTDADGNVSYTYSKKWDFEKDVFVVDPDKEYDPNEPAMTLYAAWIPYFNYEFYAKDENGNTVQIGEDKNEDGQIDPTKLINLNIPTWDIDSGEMDYKNFLSLDGKTFSAAYADEAMTQPLTATINAREQYVDYEKGIATTNTIKVYTEWMDGEWFKIYTAKQFVENSKLNGNYIICADLDFAKVRWKSTLSIGTFKGTICTENDQVFKFSNISAMQSGSNNNQGLFGVLGESATIQNISFENLTYTINTSTSLKLDTNFGTFAGQIVAGATVENVTVNGTLKIEGNLANNKPSQYEINKLVAIGSTEGIVSYDVQVSVADGLNVQEDPDDPNKLILEKGNQ